jgi:predicted secreted protein
MQDKPNRIKTLALTETCCFENNCKSQSPLQQIQNKPESKQGFAWKVETQASLRCQQEQATQKAASDELINKA